MSEAIAKVPQASERIEQVLIDGDLSGLRPEERLQLYQRVCESLGLNPLTKPFSYIRLNNKLVLYALKDCTDQLRTIHGISITLPSREVIEGVYVVTSHAQRVDGRHDESTGAVPVEGLKGEARANAMMKAETKAKRRVTLSICGLGMLDESEIGNIPGAQVEPEPQRNTIAEQSDLAQRRIQETRGDGLAGGLQPQAVGQSPAQKDTASPSQPAADQIPPPLKALFDNLGKPGYMKQAFGLLKGRLTDLSPDGASVTYERILAAHGIAPGKTTDMSEVKAALLEMWQVADEWALAAAKVGDEAVPEVKGSLI